MIIIMIKIEKTKFGGAHQINYTMWTIVDLVEILRISHIILVFHKWMLSTIV